MDNLPILTATVIGSWSFPGWYARFCDDAARDPDLYGADDRAEAVRDAARLAIDDQLRAGADLITDGEMQRVDFNLGFYDRLTGLKPLPQARRWGPPAHDQRSRYLCVAPLEAPHELREGTLVLLGHAGHQVLVGETWNRRSLSLAIRTHGRLHPCFLPPGGLAVPGHFLDGGGLGVTGAGRPAWP